MNFILNDSEYVDIVRNILDNDNFKKIDGLVHHRTNRLTHSLRVSYFSYKISKVLFLDKRKVARAGLLHDFFLTDSKDKKDRLVSVFKHSKEACDNARYNFILSPMEEDIIRTHMFPVVPNRVPKYAESWVVSLVDKGVSLYEFVNNYGNMCTLKLKNALVLLVLFLGRII